jgi:type IV pilus assembly protein PilW
MKTQLFITPRQRLQHGLTLVELMVGLTLGLVLIVALIGIFANASASSQNISRYSAQVENGRYVNELLEEDLRLAGFFGETNLGSVAYATPTGCSTAPTEWSSSPFTVPAPVVGYLPTDSLGCLTNRKSGTYAIAIHRLGLTPVAPAALGASNAQHYVQYSFCNDDDSSIRLRFGTDPANFTLRNRACTGGNNVRAYMTRIYYVADCNRCGTGGDTNPTLKRVDLVDGELVTTALADGIEELRFEYGFDTDNNGSADTYLTTLAGSGATAAWSNVMTVKAHFITRSLQKAVGSNLAGAQEFHLGGVTISKAADGYVRRAHSSVIRLVNPSGVREMQ